MPVNTMGLPSKTADIKPEDLPKVKKLPYSTSSLKQIVEALVEAGGVIVTGIYEKEQMDRISNDVKPYFEQDVAWDGDIFPAQTRRCTGAVGKSRSAADAVLGSELFWNLSRVFLEQVNWYWAGDKKEWCRSDPQLNTSIAFSIGPGAGSQPLHRDDHCHHNNMEEIENYPEDLQERETLLGFFFALERTTKANGATRFIPGSHLWGKDREPSEHLCVHAELEQGDGFFMLGSAYHGGSTNTSNVNRNIVGSFTTKGYLRQEENQYLAIPHEIIKSWPTVYQKRVGYAVSHPFGGWVELSDPIYFLDPSLKTKKAGEDLYAKGEITPFKVL